MSGQSALPSSHGATDLFPRNYEFLWKDSSLFFSDEPFEVAGTAEGPSSQSSLDPEVTSASPPAPPAPPAPHNSPIAHRLYTDDAETLGGIGGAFVGMGGGADTYSILDNEPDRQVLDVIDWMAELLWEDFMRCCGTQESRRHNRASRSQDAPHARRHPHRANGKSTKGGKGSSQRNGSERDGDGDEDPRKGKQPSRPARSKTSKHLACPFLKWKPARYEDRCMRKLTTISHVKQHLEKEHYQRYCPRCYQTLTKDQPDHRHLPDYQNARGAPPGDFVTYDAREKIKQTIDSRSKSATEKWQCIYRVIFPKESQCPNPFLDYNAWKKIDRLERHLDCDTAKRTLKEQAQRWQEQGLSGHQLTARIIDCVYARLRQQLNTDDQAYSSSDVSGDEAYDDNHSAGPAYPNQALSLDDSSNLHEIDSHDVQRFYESTAATQMCPTLGLNEHFGSMSRGDVDWETPNAAANGDLEAYGQEMDTSETPDDFSRLLGDPDFSLGSGNPLQVYEEEDLTYRLGQQLDLDVGYV